MWNHPFGRWTPGVETSSFMSPPSKEDETYTRPGQRGCRGDRLGRGSGDRKDRTYWLTGLGVKDREVCRARSRTLAWWLKGGEAGDKVEKGVVEVSFGCGRLLGLRGEGSGHLASWVLGEEGISRSQYLKQDTEVWLWERNQGWEKHRLSGDPAWGYYNVQDTGKETIWQHDKGTIP